MSFLHLLSNLRVDFLDIFFRYISFLGETTVLVPLLCILYWCVNKSMAYMGLFSFFVSGSIVQGAKIVFRIPRPWILDPSFTPVESALDTATGYSFPSGHVQSTSSIFLTFFAWSEKKWAKILTGAIVFLVLFSRMYLGCHTPLDTFTSLIISIIVVFVLNHIRKNYLFPKANKAALLIVAYAYSIGVILYSLLIVHWGVSTMELVSDTIILSCTTMGFAAGAYIENRYIRFGTSCRNIFMQLLKVVLGIGGILLINISVSFLPFERTVEKSIGGFLICIWATCIFPLFIKVVQKKNYSEL